MALFAPANYAASGADCVGVGGWPSSLEAASSHIWPSSRSGLRTSSTFASRAHLKHSLNAIWKAEPKGITVSRLIRARAASLGLVAALGFLLMVSLVVSTGLTAFGHYLNSILPF